MTAQGSRVDPVRRRHDLDDEAEEWLEILRRHTIKGQNFVDAWNCGAPAKNAQLNSYFFDPIKGYAEVSAEGSKVETLSGVKVVDDSTFTVELVSPQADSAGAFGILGLRARLHHVRRSTIGRVR